MQKPILHNQSLYDFALQHCGSVEAATAIAMLNDVAPTEALHPGRLLTLPERFNDPEMARFLKANNRTPATASTMQSQNQILDYLLPQILPLT